MKNKEGLIKFWKHIIAAVYQAEEEVLKKIRPVPEEISDEYCEEVITKMAEWLSNTQFTKE